jgi:hypothetical protein
MAKAYSDMDSDMDNYLSDDYLELDELENIKSALAQMLLSSTEMEANRIFSILFYDGDDIVWH